MNASYSCVRCLTELQHSTLWQIMRFDNYVKLSNSTCCHALCSQCVPTCSHLSYFPLRTRKHWSCYKRAQVLPLKKVRLATSHHHQQTADTIISKPLVICAASFRSNDYTKYLSVIWNGRPHRLHRQKSWTMSRRQCFTILAYNKHSRFNYLKHTQQSQITHRYQIVKKL